MSLRTRLLVEEFEGRALPSSPDVFEPARVSRR